MADDKEEAGESTTHPDPAAVGLALGQHTLDPRAAAYLARQGRLADLQAEILEREEGVRHWSLRIRHISDVLKLAFEFSVALVLLGVVALLANAVWAAAHDDGLVIEAFAVPPDLAARGLTGQVIATRMLDNLSTLQAQTNSSRAPGSFASNWGNDIKVEIPETGVSIGEVNRYLRQLLGHETHITGEVAHEGAGLTIAARAGAEPAAQFSGAESDLNGLVAQAAEAVFARTQPYRYGVHLFSQGRLAEATAHLEAYSHTGPASERAWALAGLTNAYAGRHRVREEMRAARDAVALRPDFAWGWSKLAGAATVQDQAEAALAAGRKAQQLLDGDGAAELRPEAIPSLRLTGDDAIAYQLGDFAGTVRLLLTETPELASGASMEEQVQAMLRQPGGNPKTVTSTLGLYGRALAQDHDVMGARHMLGEGPGLTAAVRRASPALHDLRADTQGGTAAQEFDSIALSIAFAMNDWPRMLQIARAMDAADGALDGPGNAALLLYPPVRIWPYIAYGMAMTGDLRGAHAEIDRTPGDCDLCLRMRGRIDAAQKNYAGAAFWFARAAQAAPSIPFAFADWGQVLLAQGKPDAAIAQFTIANQKSPHFADPLEGWGEALVAKNQSRLALAKFEEANKYAPNWGRLHLKWGEALYYAGKRDLAKAEFAHAAALDLTPSEKQELARQPHV